VELLWSVRKESGPAPIQALANTFCKVLANTLLYVPMGDDTDASERRRTLYTKVERADKALRKLRRETKKNGKFVLIQGTGECRPLSHPHPTPY